MDDQGAGVGTLLDGKDGLDHVGVACIPCKTVDRLCWYADDLAFRQKVFGFVNGSPCHGVFKNVQNYQKLAKSYKERFEHFSCVLLFFYKSRLLNYFELVYESKY